MEQHSGFQIGQHLTKRCLVFGCGNPLFGDDGFGGRVIAHLLKYYVIPTDAAALDVGTAIRDLLFDMLLSPCKPERIVIVDAMRIEGGSAGQIFAIDIDQIHPAKISDFSLHQFPTTNMLKEIREGTQIDVQILVVHPEELPPEVRPGLSPVVQAAIPAMCERIMAVIDAAGNKAVRLNSEFTRSDEPFKKKIYGSGPRWKMRLNPRQAHAFRGAGVCLRSHRGKIIC